MRYEKRKEEFRTVMKVLKQILFTGVLAAGLAISVSAQSNDPKKPPPKPDPPTVRVPDKPPPTPKPKDPKKPGFAMVALARENEAAA